MDLLFPLMGTCLATLFVPLVLHLVAHHHHHHHGAAGWPSLASHIGSGYLAERVYSANLILTTKMMSMFVLWEKTGNLEILCPQNSGTMSKECFFSNQRDDIDDLMCVTAGGNKALLSLKPTVSDHSWPQHALRWPPAPLDMRPAQLEILLPLSVFVSIFKYFLYGGGGETQPNSSNVQWVVALCPWN